MPYTDDPANVLSDAVRFYVNDTDVSNPALTDNEVLYLLAEEGDDALRAAARAAEVLAAKASSEADTKQVGPLKLSYTYKARRYGELASVLWRRANTSATSGGVYAGGISRTDKADKALDTDRTIPAFEKDMMDYPYGSTPNTSDVRARYGDW